MREVKEEMVFAKERKGKNIQGRKDSKEPQRNTDSVQEPLE